MEDSEEKKQVAQASVAQSIKGANQSLSAIVQVMKTYLQSAAQLLVCVRRKGAIGNTVRKYVKKYPKSVLRQIMSYTNRCFIRKENSPQTPVQYCSSYRHQNSQDHQNKSPRPGSHDR